MMIRGVHRRLIRAASLGILVLAAPVSMVGAQWSTTYEQFYRQASHNWAFRDNYPAVDRLFNAFDYGHAILYERLWTAPGAPISRLEQQEFDFITRRLLVKPPRIALEESAIAVDYSKLVPEAKMMFDWAHLLHRQIYDVWADERLRPEQKDAAVARLVKYYRSRRDVAFSSHPKDMGLMEGQPYSLAFRHRYPKFNGLIWSYHWLQVGLYEPLVTGKNAAERQAGVASALEHFRTMLADPPHRMPTIMPMTAAVAPEFSRRYPEVAIIFDNLHSMHDVISDILADSTVPRSRKRAEILLAAQRYRDDTSSVMTIADWRAMAADMGVANMGGASVQRDSVTRTWTTELVEAKLRGAGISAQPLPPTGRHIFMSIPAKSYRLDDGDELQLFVYPDSAARALDTSRLDSARVAPPNMMIKWRAQPTLIIDANMAAIIITNDEARRQQVRDALSRSQPHRHH
jgi:hypothetical protein